MTIIVYRDGEMWADDLVFSGRLILGRELKITYCPKDGSIAGAAGDGSACSQFLTWAKAGRPKNRFPQEAFAEGNELSAIIATKDGIIRDYGGREPCLICADFYAIGAASEVAIGAMYQGASAKEAILIACQAFGWPASLQGVNHDGQWFSIDPSEVLAATHGLRTPQLPSVADGRRTRRGC